jgi:sugar-specific transcriptional regulator TrmB
LKTVATLKKKRPLKNSQDIVKKARDMITENYAGLCILIPDVNPQERQRWLQSALNAALRWKLTNTDQRDDDVHHAIVLSDLLAELMNQAS